MSLACTTFHPGMFVISDIDECLLRMKECTIVLYTVIISMKLFMQGVLTLVHEYAVHSLVDQLGQDRTSPFEQHQFPIVTCHYGIE